MVSNSPVKKYSISRENTIAHQKVIEKVMEKYTVLPVRFSTIAESDKNESIENIKKKLLKARYKEFKNLLKEMDGKAEIGVKALYSDMKNVFQEISEENKEIKRLKKEISLRPPEKTRHEIIKIGEMVQSSLKLKKERLKKEIIKSLKPLSVDFRSNNTYGDRMILNTAFLVEISNQEAFDQEMDSLEKKYNQKIKFKYVGPVPPYNFVDLVVTWD